MKHFPQIILATSCALGLAALSQAAVETYKIDPVHSSVGFSIRHFFSNVPGVFTRFTGTIVVDRHNIENSTVEATIEVPSIDTRSGMRDNDLRSDKFFAVEKFPAIIFKSKSWKKTGDERPALQRLDLVKPVLGVVLILIGGQPFRPPCSAAIPGCSPGHSHTSTVPHHTVQVPPLVKPTAKPVQAGVLISRVPASSSRVVGQFHNSLLDYFGIGRDHRLVHAQE